VAESNIAFVRNYLAEQKIPILGQFLGQKNPLLVYFFTHSGKAMVRVIEGDQILELAKEETRQAGNGDRNPQDNRPFNRGSGGKD
jgi:hypothetical protein